MPACTLQQVSDDVVGLNRRAILNIPEHGSGEWRVFIGKPAAGTLEELFAWRVTLRYRDGPAFIQKA